MDDAPVSAVPEPLRFSSPADIDEFVDCLHRFEAGELSPDQFKVYRLTRGTYGQRQQNVNMLRVKIPQGVLAAPQVERLADVADEYSRGFGHVTTRQNVQFHFVPLARVPEAMTRLDEVGLTTREACGGTVRNVTACALAGVCNGAAFDDCLRKSRKSKRNDDSEEVGRAWLAYMEAGRKVREVGKEALSDK